MHCHCGTNNRAPWWTFTDPCKLEVRPGALEESASPAWLAAPVINARDTTKGIFGGLTLDVDRHYRGSVTATTNQEKGIITLESNPSRGTVLPAPHGKGNKCDKREIGLDIRTHASPKVGQDQVSGGVSVLCWHAAPFCIYSMETLHN